MNSNRAQLALLAALAAPAAVAQPDARTSFDPTLSRFLVRAPDYADTASKWRGGLTAAQWWVNNFAEKRLRSDLTEAIQGAVKEATPLVQWTGQVALYEMRVFRAVAATDGGWFVAQIAGGKPTYSGLGKTPEQALFAEFSVDRWKLGVPDGYEVDRIYSGFFVVQKGANGKIESKVVAKGTTYELVQRMQDNYGALEMKYQTEKMANQEAWLQMAKTAKGKLAEEGAKRKVDAALTEVLASEKRVAEINKKMSEALDREKRVGNALFLLQALKTVVDVASLVQTAIAETGEPAQAFAGAKTADAVLNKVTEIQAGAVKIRTETTVQFKDVQDSFLNQMNAFWESLKPANPPPEVQSVLKLEKVP